MNQLNDSQIKALDFVDRGFNCFITGGAGVGKSFLLRALKERFSGLVITASTGVAALNVGGNTVHSMFLPNLYYDIGHIMRLLIKTKKLDALLNLEMLAIDEISMLDGRILTQIDEILRRVKDRSKPFGGVQVIVIGDFLQLPPVPSSDRANPEKRITYAFESPSWSFKTINLKQIERQSDPEFMHLLRHLRQGHKSDNFYNLLKDRHVDDKTLDKSIIRLYPMTARCDKYNSVCQEALNTEVKEYKGTYWLKGNDEVEQKVNDKILKNLIKSTKSKEDLKLKVGDRVMLTFNIDIENNLVNGSCGEVIDFDVPESSSWELIRRNAENPKVSEYMKNILHHLADWEQKNINKCPVIKFDNGTIKTITPVVWRDVTVVNKEEVENAVYCQLPLMLAYSITIHKCVSGDTILNGNTASFLQIKDSLEDMEINTGQGTFRKIKIKSPALLKEGYKITTKCGYELICSEDHPILVNRRGTELFVKLKEIEITDMICIDRSIGNSDSGNNLLLLTEKTESEILNLNLPIELDLEFSWFLGYLVGNGNYTNRIDGRVEITAPFLYIVERIEKLLKHFRLNTTIRKKNNSNCWNIYTHSKQFRRFLEANGFNYVTAKDKSIPEPIFKSSIENIRSFLKGLFDADGSASNNLVRYCSKSLKLIKQIQILLLNSGCISYIANVTNHNYQLILCGTSLQNFATLINFDLPYKKQSLLKILERRSKSQNKTNIDFIPHGHQLLQKAKELINLKCGNTRGKKGFGIYKNKNQRMLLIDSRIKNHYFYDSIKAIEKLGMVEMYDLEVDIDNSFFANGFVAHNSQGMSLDSACVYFSGCIQYGQYYVAMSRLRSLQGLHIPPSRKGIKSYNEFFIKADPKVLNFYKSTL